MDSVPKPPFCVEPKPLNFFKTVNIDSEPEGCYLAPPYAAFFLVRKHFHIKFPLDYLNIFILELLQMTLFDWRDPYLFQSLTSNPYTFQDLIHKMNF